eukprot:TRINITY_DN34820_c0_g1_i1.p1 TRINITY_DN34820_c0_g1~~TRINITY_DN34820_c0_g1_i1.p1  ORF type:complete len:437 (+),score=94.84 TRINITY_DN34820_c0_g1_i1:80-1312(+)
MRALLQRGETPGQAQADGLCPGPPQPPPPPPPPPPRSTTSGNSSEDPSGEPRRPVVDTLHGLARLGGRLGRATTNFSTNLGGKTFQVLGDLGDEIEKRRPDSGPGNILHAIKNGSMKAGEHAGRLRGELSGAAARLVEEAVSAFDGGEDGGQVQIPEVFSGGGALGSAGSVSSSGASGGGGGSDADNRPGSLTTAGSVPEPPSQWEETRRLQSELSHERELRRGRGNALSALGTAVRDLRDELVRERCAVEEAEDERIAANARFEESERCLEAAQDEQRTLLRRKMAQEAELRRCEVAAAKAQRAAKEANKEHGAWARDGPEMEALKMAKMELAEVLSRIDEMTLQGRKDVAKLTKEIEALEADGVELRRLLENKEPEPSDAVSSFRESVLRFWRSGKANDDLRIGGAAA